MMNSSSFRPRPDASAASGANPRSHGARSVSFFALAFAVALSSPGCGVTRGVIGPDGIETRVIETYANGKPRRVERWQGERLLEDRHLYPGGATQHAVRTTADPLVQDVLVYHDDGKTLAMRYNLRKGQMEGVAEQWDLAGKLRARRTYRDGRTDGLEERLDENGMRVATATWRLGERDGAARTYYPSGKLESEILWSRGVPAEIGRSFYESGNRRAEFQLESGVRSGKELIYADGPGDKLVVRQGWKLGELHGLSETFHANGTVETRITYVHGRAEGAEEHLHDNGQVAFRVPRVNDMRQGLAERFDREGRKVSEVTYEADVTVGVEKRFFASGRLLAEIPFANGKMEGLATFYHENGKVAAKVPLKNGDAEGEELRYRDDGTLLALVPRKAGLAQGYVRLYDEKGWLERYVQYEDDLPHGRMIAVYPQDPALNAKPAVATEGFFERGKPTGEFKRWHPNAKLMEKRPHDPAGSGLLARWHDNGNRNLEVELRNGKEEGHEQIWHPEGWLWADRLWAAGTWVGEEKRFYKSGKVLGVYPVEGEKWNGVAKIYAEKGGYLWSELPYRDGKEDGEEVRYAKNGTRWAIATWQQGVLKGVRYLQQRRRHTVPVESDTWTDKETGTKRRELVDIGAEDRKRERRYYASGAIEFEVDRSKSGDWVGEAIYYYEDGPIAARVPFAAGLRQGRELRFFRTGEKEMEIPFVDDKPRGDVVSYRRDGSIAARYPAGDKAAFGVEVQYHENGQVRMTVPMVAGSRHGIARLQSADGLDVARTSYLRGRQVGFEATYHSNGRIGQLTAQVDGRREGPGVVFGRDGKRWALIPWQRGVKHGTERRFGPNGQEVVEETVYRDGAAVETRTFKTDDASPAHKEPPPAPPPAPAQGQ